jgi:hypothetical protein
VRSAAANDRRHVIATRPFVVGASVAALCVAACGLLVTVQRLEDGVRYWDGVASVAPADPVALVQGYDDGTWRKIRATVGRGDRFAVVAEGDGQYDVRNYAMYTLLPAIHVLDPGQANVVIYYDVPAPSRGCRPMGRGVCLVRKSS